MILQRLKNGVSLTQNGNITLINDDQFDLLINNQLPNIALSNVDFFTNIQVYEIDGVKMIMFTHVHLCGDLRYSEQKQLIEPLVIIGNNIPLVEKLQRVIMEDLNERAGRIGFEEHDENATYQQVIDDFEQAYQVNLPQIFTEINTIADCWEQETKMNYGAVTIVR